MGLFPGDRGIDIGCGTGYLAVALARSFKRCRFVGADPDRAALEVARANAKAEDALARLDLVQADPRHLPFKDETFAIATSAFHFSTLRGPRPTLESVFRVVFFYGKVLLLDVDLARGAAAEAATPKGVQREVFRESTLEAMRDMGFGKVKEQRVEILPGGGSVILITAKRFEGDEEPDSEA